MDTNQAQPATSRLDNKRCYTCQSTDPTHDWRACRNKKRVNNIDQTEEGDMEEERTMDFVEYEDSETANVDSSEEREIGAVDMLSQTQSQTTYMRFNEYEDSDEDIEHLEINIIDKTWLDTTDTDPDSVTRDQATEVIETSFDKVIDIAQLQAEAEVPQTTNTVNGLDHVSEARLLLTRPAAGKAHTIGHHSLTIVIINDKQTVLFLDSGAACSVVGSRFLSQVYPSWKEKLMPCSDMRFSGCGSSLRPLGVVSLPVIFPHAQGSVRIQPEFVVMENASPKYFILGSDFLSLYGIDIHHSREKHFTIGNDNKKKNFGLRTHRQILQVSTEQITEDLKLQKDPLVEEALQEIEFGPKLSQNQQQTLRDMILEYKEQFGLGKSPLGRIDKHPVTVSLTLEKPYPPILKKSPYPASPRARVEIQKHLEELLQLGVIRKVGEDEELDITTPVIIAWHNGKSRLCGDFRPLNTYTVPDRYPLPRIQHALQKLGKAVYITTMDVMKGFH